MATPKQYEHIGACPVILDSVQIEPGESFSANIPPSLESFLIQIGAIKPVEPKPAAKSPKPAEKE